MRNIPICRGESPRALSQRNLDLFAFKRYGNKIWFIAVLVSIFTVIAANGASWASTTPQIAAGAYHTLTIKADGTVWAWGCNTYGQLGDGTTTYRMTPVLISGMDSVSAIAAGEHHTVAVKSDGTVWTWGYNSFGQLGDGTTTNRTTPAQVSSLSNVIAIAAGYYYAAALKSDGTVWTWGYNVYGQLGDGTTTNRNTPVQVSSLSGVIALATGYGHTIALKSDGTVWAWGLNVSGQLGNGTSASKTTPVQVSGLSGVSAVVTRYSHTVALKSDGTVWAWGFNQDGQLGDGTTTNRYTPVQVSSLSGVTALATGYGHTAALKSDGTVWTWGYNSYGQLGDGTNGPDANRYTPAQVSSLSVVIAIATGENYTIALKSDGTVWTWGRNSYGSLGDGTNINKNTPVKVNINLQETATLPIVTTGTATNVTSSSATLNGTVNANGTSTTAWFNYGITSGSYTGTSTTQSVSGSSDTSISAAISGLSASTAYYYRIAAQSSAGTSYGSETSFTTSAATIDLNNGLVAYYPFTGNANDGSGNGNHGTVYGASLTTDKFGNTNNAYSFDGVNDYINISDSSSLDLTTQFTLSAWIYPTSLMQDPAQGGIISKVGGVGGNNGYQFVITDTNSSILCQFNAAGESWPSNSLIASNNVPLNEWSHVVCTYDNNTSRIYYNGTLVGSKVIGSKSIVNSSSNFRISSDDNGNVWFAGSIDEIAVYNRALSASEIQQLYGGGTTTPTPTPPPSDTTAPSGTVSINSGASYTNSTSVTLTLSATDSVGVTGYYLSDRSTTPSASASGWTSVTSTTSYSGSVSYTLSSGEGSKTIYAWYKDAAGNVSSTASDTITLDTTSPTVSITSPTTSTTYTATSSTVSLSGSASDSTSGISEVSWSNSKGGSGTASGTASWSISSISLSSGDNVITVTAKDGAGNTNTDTITITYTATTAQPPTVTTGSATNVTSTSATLTGTVNANGLSTTAWFNYGVISGFYTGTSTTQTVSGSGATNVSATISGLSSNTNYSYRIVARNSAGISYGSAANLTTSAATPMPTPTVQPTPTKPPTLPPLPTLPPIPNISPTPSVECSQDGGISIQSIDPSEGTVLEVGKTYTFTVSVKYEFITAIKGSIGINAHDPNTGENLDNQTQNGVNVSSKSGEETVSVTTKISQNGNPVTVVGINVALFPDGYTCTYVSDRIQYKTDAASTTPAPVPTPTLPQKGGTVFGFVNDADENPLKGVTVTITGKGSFLVISGDGGKKVTMADPGSVLAVSTETDEDGYYEFVGLEAGVYALAYEKEGYVTQTQEVSLKEGEVKELGTVIMEEVEKEKITGYVVNIKGDPIESVRLRLRGIKTKVTRSASSDADGYFEFEDLDADTYVILAKKRGYKKSKKTVKLEEGESEEIEIEMRKTSKRGLIMPVNLQHEVGDIR
jgi:alpha-tubulin suppressor-like RCC1 family protein